MNGHRELQNCMGSSTLPKRLMARKWKADLPDSRKAALIFFVKHVDARALACGHTTKCEIDGWVS
jgi:hypothetical protein